jgi:predicted component of type VI protein secretion system
MPDDAAPKPRTIDERLDGLTQTLEIVAAMQRDNEKRFAEIAKVQEQDGEHIRALVRIAELHDRRLTNLEDQQQ